MSGFVSLSLTPMLTSRMLKPHGEEKHGRLYLLSERWFNALHHGYAHTLAWCMARQRFVLAVFLAITAG